MDNQRIILLEHVPPDERQAIIYCFYCRSCPYDGKKVQAVAAVERTTATVFPPGKRISYTGICANHAEVYPLTEEEAERKPLLCPYCFNQDGTRKQRD